jgi:ribonuclease Z
MKMTLTRTSDTYIVHELLRPEDPVTPCDDALKDSPTRMDPALPTVMHFSELRGTDFIATAEGFWKGITLGSGRYHGVDINVDAGPILHRGNI